MIAWETLSTIPANSGALPLSLHRRGEEYVIRAGGIELMSSRRSGSETALARLAAAALDVTWNAEAEIAGQSASISPDGSQSRRILVGGLGMGFTAAAALAAFPDAHICVAEIEGRIVDWNRSWLAPLAGRPLEDPRLELLVEDLSSTLDRSAAGPPCSRFDAILLDVDNGPEALSRARNARLYEPGGLGRTARALRPDGVAAYWSAGPDEAFGKRLTRTMKAVETHRVPPHGRSRGRARHTIWLGRPRR